MTLESEQWTSRNVTLWGADQRPLVLRFKGTGFAAVPRGQARGGSARCRRWVRVFLDAAVAGWCCKAGGACGPGLCCRLDGTIRRQADPICSRSRDGQFGSVLMMDVIEHVDDDVGLIRQYSDFMRQDGPMLMPCQRSNVVKARGISLSISAATRMQVCIAPSNRQV